jgi:hypothetical protein
MSSEDHRSDDHGSDGDHRSDSVPRRIDLGNEVLVPDAEFCAEQLGGATRRTGSRLDGEGLPYVIIAGRKYRPLNEGRTWVANRIVRKQPQRALRRGRPAKP